MKITNKLMCSEFTFGRGKENVVVWLLCWYQCFKNRTGPVDPTVGRSPFRSGPVIWTGWGSNRGRTGRTGSPTGEPNEPAGSIDFNFFLKKQHQNDVVLMLLASKWRRFGVLFKQMRSPGCAVATSKLQLQPFLLRPSSTSYRWHQGIPPTACDSSDTHTGPACGPRHQERSATPKVASPLFSARRRSIPARHQERSRRRPTTRTLVAAPPLLRPPSTHPSW